VHAHFVLERSEELYDDDSNLGGEHEVRRRDA
jgi:hypothetical protein